LVAASKLASTIRFPGCDSTFSGFSETGSR